MNVFRLIFIYLTLVSSLFADGTLTVGTQFGWPVTAQPAQRGNPSNLGYAYQPTARWELPSWQTYTTSKVISVLAFHPCAVDNVGGLGVCGIQKISFICNNGPVLDVNGPSVNPETGLWGWWCYQPTAALNAALETRAIIYPVDGVPLVLQGGNRLSVGTAGGPPDSQQSLVLWSNGDPTVNSFTRPDMTIDSVSGSNTTGDGSPGNPYADIRKALVTGLGNDGNNAYIYCKPGTYLMPRDGPVNNKYNTRSRYLTILPAPGVTRSQVKITVPDGTLSTSFKLIRLKDVTIDRSLGLDITKRLGTIDNRKNGPGLAEPIPPAGIAGRWFTTHLNGTLTDPDAPLAITDADGSYIYDNGTAWVYKLDPVLFSGPSSGDKTYIWMDGAELYGKGRYDGVTSTFKNKNSSGMVAWTKSATNRGYIHDWGDVAEVNAGFMSCLDTKTITGDLANATYVRYCTWTDQRPTEGVHGDWVQESAVNVPNAIWADNRCDDASVQLWFQTDTQNIIRHFYVNNILFKYTGDGKGSNLYKSIACGYWNNTHGNQIIGFKIETLDGNGLDNGIEDGDATSFYANIWGGDYSKATLGGIPINNSNAQSLMPQHRWDYNHSYRNSGFNPGSSTTFGTVRYRGDVTNHDYYPTAPAGVTDFSVPAIVPWDQRQEARGVMTRKGAVENDGSSSSSAFPPAFNPEASSFETVINVTITSPGASNIYYTVNGTTPTSASTLYTGPVAISSTTTLKAFAQKVGLTDSTVSTGLFTIDLSGRPSPPSSQQIVPLDHP